MQIRHPISGAHPREHKHLGETMIIQYGNLITQCPVLKLKAVDGAILYMSVLNRIQEVIQAGEHQ